MRFFHRRPDLISRETPNTQHRYACTLPHKTANDLPPKTIARAMCSRNCFKPNLAQLLPKLSLKVRVILGVDVIVANETDLFGSAFNCWRRAFNPLAVKM